MWNYLYISLAIIFLAILSHTDIKERTAPPFFTHGMLILGLTLHLVQSAVTSNPNPILYSSSVALAMFSISYAIYLMGGWAGGDVKLFTALGALLPYYGTISQITFPIPFPVLILAASTISVLPFILIYGTYHAVKQDGKQLMEDIKKSLPKSLYSALTLTAALTLTKILGIHPAATLAIAPAIYLTKKYGYPVTAFLFTLAALREPISNLITFGYFIGISILLVTGTQTYRSIKNNVLRKEKKAENLEEGDIPAEDIWLVQGKPEKREPKIVTTKEKGKLIINSRKARGLTEKEIEWIKNKGITTLKTKKSLPFIPVVTLGLVILIVLETFI